MAHVNKASVLPATQMFFQKRNEPYLPLLPAIELHCLVARTHFPCSAADGRRLS